jgi:hypothetical protein
MWKPDIIQESKKVFLAFDKNHNISLLHGLFVSFPSLGGDDSNAVCKMVSLARPKVQGGSLFAYRHMIQ